MNVLENFCNMSILKFVSFFYGIEDCIMYSVALWKSCYKIIISRIKSNLHFISIITYHRPSRYCHWHQPLKTYNGWTLNCRSMQPLPVRDKIARFSWSWKRKGKCGKKTHQSGKVSDTWKIEPVIHSYVTSSLKIENTIYYLLSNNILVCWLLFKWDPIKKEFKGMTLR